MAETSNKLPPIVPLILSGGAGMRLWPRSRRMAPKQFQTLSGEGSLFTQTVARVADRTRFAAPLVVAQEAHRFAVIDHLGAAGVGEATLLIEPQGRNTAPALAAAALYLKAHVGGDALLLVLPSDHLIQDRAGFEQAVATGARAAATGLLVTFGVVPTRPETGYGYIRTGATLAALRDTWQVDRFVEKPDLATATAMVAEGAYLWNAGIFMLPVDALLQELERHAPQVLAAARIAVEEAGEPAVAGPLQTYRLGPSFVAAPSISIDYAVMEPTDRAAVVPVSFGWTDVGAWSAIWDIGRKDPAGNATQGEVVCVNATGNLAIAAPRRTVALVGVEDLVVVETDDATLVTTRDNAQQVKHLVETLTEQQRAVATTPRKVHRPWGWYDGVHAGEGFQVKHISVKPGGRLSLQKHAHRAEHWVVVSGTARVTVDDDVRDVSPGQSAYIPLGAVHRLENFGDEPVHLIEVQLGSYLGEDDIVRLEDVYGRS